MKRIRPGKKGTVREYEERWRRKCISVRECDRNEKKRPGKKGRLSEYEKGKVKS